MSQRSVTQFAYRRHPDQERTEGKAAHHPVIIVGAGPIGLSLAIDLAQRGQAVVLLDDTDRIGDGSRAICFSKRSLDLWDRLGVGERMVEKGIAWKVGKIFLKDEGLSVRSVARRRAQDAGFHQSSTVLCRSLSGRPRSGIAADRSALAKQGRWSGVAQRPRHC